jgi:hypothetical protein
MDRYGYLRLSVSDGGAATPFACAIRHPRRSCNVTIALRLESRPESANPLPPGRSRCDRPLPVTTCCRVASVLPSARAPALFSRAFAFGLDLRMIGILGPRKECGSSRARNITRPRVPGRRSGRPEARGNSPLGTGPDDDPGARGRAEGARLSPATTRAGASSNRLEAPYTLRLIAHCEAPIEAARYASDRKRRGRRAR